MMMMSPRNHHEAPVWASVCLAKKSEAHHMQPNSFKANILGVGGGEDWRK